LAFGVELDVDVVVDGDDDVDGDVSL